METKIGKQGITPNFKRALSFLLSFVMLFSITAGIDLSAYAEIDGGFENYKYTLLADGTAEIKEYDGEVSEVVIPFVIDGYTVTSIGDKAFYDWGNSKKFTKITIPNTVTNIGDYSFANCKLLKEVNIPNSVVSIGQYAFYACWKLSNLTISNSLKVIENSAFKACGLTSVEIPNSVITIGEFAFANNEISQVNIPGSVKYINNNAFSGNKIKHVIVPENVVSIGENAFLYAYSGSTSIRFNNTNISIANNAVSKSTKIYGYCNSTASQYAKENGNEFVVLSHTWDSGKVTKSPTCTKEGIKVYTCTSCGETKTESISALGHYMELEVIQGGPTAAQDAILKYTCQVCGETQTEIIPATGLKAPTLKATVNANGSFTLSWDGVNEADQYELYIKQSDGSYKLMKTTTATSFTTAVAAYGKQYSYKVCAVNNANSAATSDFSNTVNATNNKKLATPTLKATVNANGTFKLSWNAVTGATAYELYIKQADGSYKLMKTTTATSFTTAFATYGKQFSYTMRAVTSKNKSAASAYSSAVNATNNKKLQTPTMKATVNANGTFKLSWNKVTGAEKYELYIKQANGSYKLMKTTTATSFTTAFATYGKQFSYKMRAVTSKNKSAASAYSSVVNANNTKKLQTPSLKVAVNKNGSFKLSWGKVTGATSYQIYMKQANGSYKLIKTTSSTSFTTAVAAKGKTYSYKVRAVTSKNKNATSNYSKVVSAKRK